MTRPKGSPEELERRRMRAIQLLRQGQAPVEVARIVGADRRSVRRWKAAHAKKGAAGIRARPAPGRPPKMGAGDRRRLEAILLEGARAAGFATDLWTCPRIAELLQDRFGVDYHVDHVGRLLHAMGWSPQKPQRRAAERDEEAIRTWIRREWPPIKKKPRK